MRRLVFLLSLLLAAPLAAQPRKVGSGTRLVGTPVGYATLTAPSGCVAGSVAVFLGSPVSMGCDAGLTYDAATDALTVAGTVDAAIFKYGNTFLLGYGDLFLGSAGHIRFSSAAAVGSNDSGLTRGGPGQVKATSGGSNLGSLQAGNLTATALGQVVGVTVTPQGANDGATYGYIVVPFLNDATWGTASAQALTVVGATVLNATDKNKIDWTALANAAYYNVYRTSGGATNGLIGTTTATTFDDTGLVAGVGVPAGNTTGRILVGDGSAAAPSVAFANTDRGFASMGSVQPSIVTAVGGQGRLAFTSGGGGAGGLLARGDGFIGFASDGNITSSSTADVLLTRGSAAAMLQLGAAPNGTPVANTLIVGESALAGSAVNVAGANGTITSGAGTGSGTGSSLIFQTPTPGGSGSGAQTMTTRLTLSSVGVNVPNLATYADNAAALSGGLVAGDLYRTSSGVLMVTY